MKIPRGFSLVGAIFCRQVEDQPVYMECKNSAEVDTETAERLIQSVKEFGGKRTLKISGTG